MPMETELLMLMSSTPSWPEQSRIDSCFCINILHFHLPFFYSKYFHFFENIEENLQMKDQMRHFLLIISLFKKYFVCLNNSPWNEQKFHWICSMWILFLNYWVKLNIGLILRRKKIIKKTEKGFVVKIRYPLVCFAFSP